MSVPGVVSVSWVNRLRYVFEIFYDIAEPTQISKFENPMFLEERLGMIKIMTLTYYPFLHKDEGLKM